MISIWTAKLPLKIKMFLWQVCNGKVQSVEQLAKGPTECKLCGQVESIEHIFVQCALVTEICFFSYDFLQKLFESQILVQCTLVWYYWCAKFQKN
jgi:hypothetical protein